jgi:molecular chaperone HtpG
MVEPIDEYMVQKLTDYESKKLVSITKEGLELESTDEEKEQLEKDKKDTEDLCKLIKEVLSNNVEKVVLSNRLSNSPCCLVTGQYGWSANMERIMKAQALRANNGMHMSPKKTMEINPQHPIIKCLRDKIKNEGEQKSVKDLIWLLYDTSLLSSGFTNDDPVRFSNRILRLISLGLDIDDIQEMDDLPPPKEEQLPESYVVPGFENESAMEQVD